MKLAVILVNYNGKKYNAACIDSILASTGIEAPKIIVVDNASQDASMCRLEEQYRGREQLELIRLDDNYGFSYANNVGMRRALGALIMYCCSTMIRRSGRICCAACGNVPAGIQAV